MEIKVVMEVANKLKSLSHSKKDVARISGDEFIIVIHELTSIEEVEKIAKEIKSLFDLPLLIDSKVLNISRLVLDLLYTLSMQKLQKNY